MCAKISHVRKRGGRKKSTPRSSSGGGGRRRGRGLKRRGSRGQGWVRPRNPKMHPFSCPTPAHSGAQGRDRSPFVRPDATILPLPKGVGAAEMRRKAATLNLKAAGKSNRSVDCAVWAGTATKVHTPAQKNLDPPCVKKSHTPKRGGPKKSTPRNSSGGDGRRRERGLKRRGSRGQGGTGPETRKRMSHTRPFRCLRQG